MRKPNISNQRSAPRAVTFKRHAHLFTLISVVWTVFTLLGVFLFWEDRDKDHNTEVLVAIGIWALHAVFVGLSIYFWRNEQASVLTVESDDGGGD